MRSSIPFVPPFLYNEKIINEIDKLIFFGEKNYSDLRDCDKDTFTTLIIEISDSDTIFFGGGNYDKLLKHFSDFLKTGSSMDAYDTLCQLRKNAADCFEHELDLLFEEMIQDRSVA